MPIETTPPGQNAKTEVYLGHEVKPLSETLAKHGLDLRKDKTSAMQINVGLFCNQTCSHCHLDSGPGRTELMNRQTIQDVVAYARRAGFQTVDITGGAPELNPNPGYLIETIAPETPRLMIRTNLTCFGPRKKDDLLGLFTVNRVVNVASVSFRELV